MVLLENDQYEQGKSLLANLGQMKAPSTELRGLRDRANLSLGLKQLRLGLPEDALESLSRIRLEGPLSNQALLASGWAWYQLDQFDKASNPWRLLIRRNAVDAATQEAILAIPANYAKSEQSTLAVRHYEIAVKQFDLQLELLNNAVGSIENDGLIAALQENALLYDRSSLQRLPPSSDVTAQLHILMASTEFQREIKRYQEIMAYISYLVSILIKEVNSWRFVYFYLSVVLTLISPSESILHLHIPASIIKLFSF